MWCRCRCVKRRIPNVLTLCDIFSQDYKDLSTIKKEEFHISHMAREHTNTQTVNISEGVGMSNRFSSDFFCLRRLLLCTSIGYLSTLIRSPHSLTLLYTACLWMVWVGINKIINIAQRWTVKAVILCFSHKLFLNSVTKCETFVAFCEKNVVSNSAMNGFLSPCSSNLIATSYVQRPIHCCLT